MLNKMCNFAKRNYHNDMAVIYTKKATTYDEQIEKLRSRGVIISNEVKAKEYLSDIGYYRLGFYTHPFEKTYPLLGRTRKHDVKEGTSIESIVAFYYYNLDLRNILNRYLSRIEVAIRTTMVYELSNKYRDDPFWYVNPNVVNQSFVNDFKQKVYDTTIKKKDPIRRHHEKYIGTFAPAWKTMEFTTFGNLEALYDNLRLNADKCLISQHFEEPAMGKFKNYLSVIREVRNSCAHGNVMVGLKLTNNVEAHSKACPSLAEGTQNTFCGALRVIDYMLKTVSVNRANEMWKELFETTHSLYSKIPSLQPLVEQKTGIILPPAYSKV